MASSTKFSGVVIVAVSAIMASIAGCYARATIPDFYGGVAGKLKLYSSSAFLEELDVSRSDFPADFTFGVATSAAQVIKYVEHLEYI